MRYNRLRCFKKNKAAAIRLQAEGKINILRKKLLLKRPKRSKVPENHKEVKINYR